MSSLIADFIALRVKVGAAVDALRMKLSQLWWFKKVGWQNMQGKVRSWVKREETDDLGVQMRFQMKTLSQHSYRRLFLYPVLAQMQLLI